MRGRTVILVSHHVQLCAPGADHIVALDNGRVQFSGGRDEFQSSGVMSHLVQSSEDPAAEDEPDTVQPISEKDLIAIEDTDPSSESSTIAPTPPEIKADRKAPRKLVEEETRAVGRIGRDVWQTYIRACGNGWYWAVFISVLVTASVSPVLENGWLRSVLTIP